jgi:hypothetical protein
MCVEEFGEEVVEGFWSFQVGQVTGARNDVMSRIGNCAAHECVYRNARVIVLADNEQNGHV